MKNHICKNLSKSISCVIFISLIPFKGDYLKAEYSFNDIDIDSSTKTDNTGSVIPTNPFEIVEIIRRSNSMNDATKPSDAIDDALEIFNKLEENNKL